MQAQKFELSPSVGYHTNQDLESPRPSPDHIPHIRKKISLIAFRQILPNILPTACIFSYTIMTCLKKLSGTKSFNTKQCHAGLFPRIMPQVSFFLPKISSPLMLLCCINQVWTLSPSPEGETMGWERILLNSQKFNHFCHQKNLR